MENENTLLNALKEHGGTDVIVSYKDIAKIFPSSKSHPESFEYKSIDDSSLLEWATKHGWEVSKVPEQAPSNAKLSPPIRFIKIV